MTRILTENEKYQCGSCGADLYRPTVTSFSVFKSGPFSSKGTIPNVYLCEECGYVGSDLSIAPSEEVQRILDSKEYRFLFEHTFRYDEPIFFLMGYLCLQLKQYSEAAYWLCRSHLDKGMFKMDKAFDDRLMDELSEKRGLDFELLVSTFYDVDGDFGRCYVRELVFDCSREYPFETEASSILFLHIIDALRRNGHFKEALEALDLRKQAGQDDNASLIEQERALCEEEKATTLLDIPMLL